VLEILRQLRQSAIDLATLNASPDVARKQIRDFALSAREKLRDQPNVPPKLHALIERSLSDDSAEQTKSLWEIVHALDGMLMAATGSDPDRPAPPTIGVNMTKWTLVAMAIFAAIAWFALR
jgi:hypothetical protein